MLSPSPDIQVDSVVERWWAAAAEVLGQQSFALDSSPDLATSLRAWEDAATRHARAVEQSHNHAAQRATLDQAWSAVHDAWKHEPDVQEKSNDIEELRQQLLAARPEHSALLLARKLAWSKPAFALRSESLAQQDQRSALVRWWDARNGFQVQHAARLDHVQEEARVEALITDLEASLGAAESALEACRQQWMEAHAEEMSLLNTQKEDLDKTDRLAAANHQEAQEALAHAQASVAAAWGHLSERPDFFKQVEQRLMPSGFRPRPTTAARRRSWDNPATQISPAWGPAHRTLLEPLLRNHPRIQAWCQQQAVSVPTPVVNEKPPASPAAPDASDLVVE